MMFNENNVNVLIIKVPKWTSMCYMANNGNNDRI